MASKLAFAAKTDVGLKRTNNEDNFAVIQSAGLYVLADGMGGHASGQVASTMCVSHVAQYICEMARQPGFKLSFPTKPEWSFEAKLLANAIMYANERVFIQSCKDRSMEGMGTTVTAIFNAPHGLVLAHVGDSRIYRVRKGEITQMTRDHSLMNHLIDKGELRPEDAANFANKNVILRAIGLKDEVEVDIKEVPREKGDIYMMCSDGLSDLVSDSMICKTIAEAHTLDDACSSLIGLALKAGGKDNVTVVCVSVEEEDAAQQPKPQAHIGSMHPAMRPMGMQPVQPNAMGMGQGGMGPGMGQGGMGPGMGPAGMAQGGMGPGMGPAGMAQGGMGPGMGPAGMAQGGMGPGMGPAGMAQGGMGPGMGPAGMGAGMAPGMGPASMGTGMGQSGMGPAGMGQGGMPTMNAMTPISAPMAAHLMQGPAQGMRPSMVAMPGVQKAVAPVVQRMHSVREIVETKPTQRAMPKPIGSAGRSNSTGMPAVMQPTRVKPVEAGSHPSQEMAKAADGKEFDNNVDKANLASANAPKEIENSAKQDKTDLPDTNLLFTAPPISAASSADQEALNVENDKELFETDDMSNIEDDDEASNIKTMLECPIISDDDLHTPPPSLNIGGATRTPSQEVRHAPASSPQAATLLPSAPSQDASRSKPAALRSAQSSRPSVPSASRLSPVPGPEIQPFKVKLDNDLAQMKPQDGAATSAIYECDDDEDDSIIISKPVSNYYIPPKEVIAPPEEADGDSIEISPDLYDDDEDSVTKTFKPTFNKW